MSFLIYYIVSVIAINYAFSAAPQWDILWSAWGGLIFILRDMVQVRYGHGALLAMGIASGLSYWLADPAIALASMSAFLLSELIDWIVFSITGRPLRDRLWLSAAASIPVDTVVFFGMIGVWETRVLGVSLLSKFAGVTVVWLIMHHRERRLRK